VTSSTILSILIGFCSSGFGKSFAYEMIYAGSYDTVLKVGSAVSIRQRSRRHKWLSRKDIAWAGG